MATKVTFNGPNRVIEVKSGVTTIDVTTDLYSDWKEWILGLDPFDTASDNSKYAPAFRTVGGEPLTGGETIGRFYFLINNWRIKTHPSQTGELILVGNLFTEDASNFLTQSNPVVRQNFSALTYIQNVSGSGGGLTSTQDTKLSAIYVSQSLFDTIISSQSIVQQSGSLSAEQQIMLFELYRLMGLDPTRPLIVTPDNRQAGTEVSQSIVSSGISGSTVTVTRV